MNLDRNLRYIQIAFNYSVDQVRKVISRLRYDPRIIIEAGTPYIKREGMAGVRVIRNLYNGFIVADMKVTDGAAREVAFARDAGANAVTAMGSAPVETLDIFNKVCKQMMVYSMIDMLGVVEPLKKLMRLKYKPQFVVIHKGRDEERNPRSMIRFKDINKVRSKFDVLISVAGGLDEENVRSAYFNGADVAILNVVRTGDGTSGLKEIEDFNYLITKVLREVGN
ncbi:MAG: orotidine 5'-phosphate decarboxylase / HUMPS family protein [Candidatus Hodarchaeota archaeon]